MTKPNIFYFCYSNDEPRGGQKETYQHVDILNRNGYQAFVFHPADDFRLTWFENETKVINRLARRSIYDETRDYIVLPEDLGARIRSYPGKKVIFNKNLYYGFTTFRRGERYYPYHDPQVVCAFVVSEHNKLHLNYAYPGLDVIRVRPGIDLDLFSYVALKRKKKQVACILKSKGQLLTLYHTLRSRAEAGLNPLKEYEWVFINGQSEREVANTLRDSILFIFLSVEEGLPRMPLEAMSCGCLVAGFRSGALGECLPPNIDFEYGDIMGIADFIEEVAKSSPEKMDQWQASCEIGRDKASAYSLKEQEDSVLMAWESILLKEPGRRPQSLDLSGGNVSPNPGRIGGEIGAKNTVEL
jgi:glycosyltransferase involved in cell wall biosynthesis